jgi:DNA invertase Pin-like site-specific DNA recombinase
MTNANNRAAILARCSSESNVHTQIANLKHYAANRYTVNEDDIYGDNVGGACPVDERAELSKLMQNIEAGNKQYDVVLVQDATRLGKTPEVVNEIMNWFEERGVRVEFVAQ